MITTKKTRIFKAGKKVVANVAIVAGSTIVVSVLGKKSRDAVSEVVDGSKQIYNVIVNTFQQW